MWGKLIELARDLFDLRQQVKGHDKKLDDSARFAREMTAGFNQVSERLLKLEMQFEFQKEQQAAEVARLKEELARLKEEQAREREHWQQRQLADRESFRLQIENLILRMQRGLPPPGLPEKPDNQ